MSDQSGSSHLRVLFETALQDYETQTGEALAKHPLAKQLQDCGSVESVAAVLNKQAQEFSKFREKDKIMKPLKTVLSVLHQLSAPVNVVIGTVRPQALTVCSMFLTLILQHFPPVKAIQTALSILLSVCDFLYTPSAHLCDL